jgi:hypothetical protein
MSYARKRSSEESIEREPEHESKSVSKKNEKQSEAVITYPSADAEPANTQNTQLDGAAQTLSQHPKSVVSPEQSGSAYYTGVSNSYGADANPTSSLQQSRVTNLSTDPPYEKWPPPPVYVDIGESTSRNGTEKPTAVQGATKGTSNNPPDDTVIDFADENVHRSFGSLQTDKQIRMGEFKYIGKKTRGK